jgi:hypothetical protein
MQNTSPLQQSNFQSVKNRIFSKKLLLQKNMVSFALSFLSMQDNCNDNQC